MIADRVLRKTLQNLVLATAQFLDPFAHIIQHFLLNLGTGVVEVRMEAATTVRVCSVPIENNTYRADNISSVTWCTFIDVSSQAFTIIVTACVFDMNQNYGAALMNRREGAYEDDLSQVSSRLVEDQILFDKLSFGVINRDRQRTKWSLLRKEWVGSDYA